MFMTGFPPPGRIELARRFAVLSQPFTDWAKSIGWPGAEAGPATLMEHLISVHRSWPYHWRYRG